MRNEGLLWARGGRQSQRETRPRGARCWPRTSAKPSATERSGPGDESNHQKRVEAGQSPTNQKKMEQRQIVEDDTGEVSQTKVAMFALTTSKFHKFYEHFF